MSQNILVIRLSSLGDVALTVPVIMELLIQYPQVSVDFVAPKFMHDLFPKHERLHLIDFDKQTQHKGFMGIMKFSKSLNTRKYSAFADLHNVLRTQILSQMIPKKSMIRAKIDKGRAEKQILIRDKKVLSPLKSTATRYADVFAKLGFPIHLNFELKDYLELNKQARNGIGIAPFAKHPGKMYDLDTMELVVKSLAKNHNIYVFGAKSELESLKNWEKIENVKLIFLDSLSQELALIANLQVMISMDSANMHLASLVGTPVVSVWGVTHPAAGFLGYGQSWNWIVQDENLNWRPTSIFGKTLGPSNNPNGMKNIEPEQIINKVEQIIALQ